MIVTEAQNSVSVDDSMCFEPFLEVLICLQLPLKSLFFTCCGRFLERFWEAFGRFLSGFGGKLLEGCWDIFWGMLDVLGEVLGIFLKDKLAKTYLKSHFQNENEKQYFC